MTVIDELMAEHRVIEQMLTTLETLAHRLDGGADRTVPLLIDFLDLLERYVDKLHHTKEERRLFEIVVERGLAVEGAGVKELLHHHETGRSQLLDLASELRRLGQGDRHAAAGCAMAAHKYAELLRAHIRMEDLDVFPLVAKAMSAEEDHSLARFYAEFDGAQGAADLRARIDQLLVRCAGLDHSREGTEPSVEI